MSSTSNLLRILLRASIFAFAFLLTVGDARGDENRVCMAMSDMEQQRETREEDRHTTLLLRGTYCTQSEPAPAPSSPKMMMQFLQQVEHRKGLLSAGHTLEAHEIDMSDEILEHWKKKAPRVGAHMPDNHDLLFSLRTGGLHVPGLHVQAIAIVGSKLLPPDDTSPVYPYIENVPIMDEREARGFKPLVWVFNQLTGSKDSANIYSLGRITVQPAGDGNSHDMIQFNAVTSLEIEMNFPSFLLRLLPVSKAKVEERGSAAVVQKLEKDVDLSMAALHQSYCDFVKSSG